MVSGHAADPVPRFRRTLEAGCGAGHFARALTERYGLRVFPVDLGWEGLRHGKRLGVDRLAQADISQLPFPRGGEYSSVRELARVLAPGGVLAVRVAALDALRSRHSEWGSH